MSEDKQTKARTQTRNRQQRLRDRRRNSGHIRREYWATPGEHDKLADALADMRPPEDPDAFKRSDAPA